MKATTVMTALWSLCCIAMPAQAEPAPIRQLTSDPYQDGYTEWSPDGQFVVYTSVRNEKEKLWKVSAKGGDPASVTDYRSHHARFSPDGNYIAFDGENGTLVQVMPAAGGTPVRVVPESILIERSGNPCWSPDGTRLAFHSRDQLWTVDLPTGRTTKIFTRPGHVVIPAHWSKRENVIIAALFNVEEKKSDLWKIPVEGGDAKQLTTHGDATHARVSPDETLIAFSSRAGGNSNLLVMSYEGGKAVKLTSDPTHEFEASWSPKGDMLAFTRVTEGKWDICVMDVNREQILKDLKAP